jgi:hypothetical protein
MPEMDKASQLCCLSIQPRCSSSPWDPSPADSLRTCVLLTRRRFLLLASKLALIVKDEKGSTCGPLIVVQMNCFERRATDSRTLRDFLAGRKPRAHTRERKNRELHIEQNNIRVAKASRPYSLLRGILNA